MHPVVLRHFVDLLTAYPPGQDVLELGAIPETSEAFSAEIGPGGRYVGLDLAAQRSGSRWTMIAGNANALPFAAGSFDAVISNSMLEHDRYFWLTLAEISRVLRPGGLFFVGMPGYDDLPALRTRIAYKLGQLAAGVGLDRVRDSRALGRLISTRTYPFHAAPSDYYRFSPAAMTDVIMQGFDVLRFDRVHIPVRVVAVGRKLTTAARGKGD